MRVETMQVVALRRSARALAIAAIAVVPSSVLAQTWTWGISGNGNFNTPANWSPASVPASANNTALVFNGGGYTSTNDIPTQPFKLNSLTFGASSAVTVTGGTLTFDGSAPAIRMNGAGSVTLGSALVLNVNTSITGAGTGSLSLTGPINSVPAVGLIKVNTSTVSVTASGSSIGFLQANAGTTTFAGATVSLTSTSVSALNGSLVTTNSLAIGNASGQSAVVNITGGSVIKANNVFAGNALGSTGVLNVSGAGTSLSTNLTDFTLGRFGSFSGNSQINVTAGASVTGLSLENRGAGGTTSVNFTGSGSLGTFGQIIGARGNNSNFSLNIGVDATVQSLADVNNDGAAAGATGIVAFGDGLASHSAVNIAGTLKTDFLAQFQFATGDNSIANMNVTGTLNCQDGTQVLFGIGDNQVSNISVSSTGSLLYDGGYFGGGLNGKTTVVIDGGTLVDSGISFYSAIGSNFDVDAAGSTNSFTVKNGGHATFGNALEVGINFQSTNAFSCGLTVTGSGSTLDTISSMDTAASENVRANVLISAGAAVTADVFTLASGAGSVGTFTVDGGSFLTFNSSFNGNFIGNFFDGGVGDGASGTLVVKGGGTFTLSGYLLVGVNTDSSPVSGAVVVDGSGTSFTEGTDLVLGASAGSTGTFTASNLASVTVGSELDIGADASTSASMTINSGANVLVISDVFMGTGAGSVSSLTVSGAASQLAIGQSLIIGGGGGDGVGGGTATVVVNSGSVSVTGDTIIGFSDSPGLSTGTASLTVNGGSVTTAEVLLGAYIDGSNNLIDGRAGSLSVTGGTMVVSDPALGPGGIFMGQGGISVSGGQLTAGFLQRVTNTSAGNVVVSGSGKLLLNYADESATEAATGVTNASLQGNGTVTLSSSVLEQVFLGTTSTFSGSLTVTGGGPAFGGVLALAGSPVGHGKILNGAALTVGPNSAFVALSNNTVGANPRTGSEVVILKSLSIDSTGFVDLQDNDMIIQGGASSLATVRGYVNNWITHLPTELDGLGTTSTSYVSNASTGKSYVTLAVVANTATGGVPYFSSYDGVTLTASDLLVKFTYVGDTNLDGKLNALDLENVIEGLSTGKSGWEWGDVNYSGGAVNAADFAAFIEAYNYVTGLGASAPNFGNGTGGEGDGGAVPEPGSLALLAPAAALLSRRRRKA